ncbi:hypothetical protein SCG7109_BC_00050 [Chlamydiales bacterium SCGC AG-110-M15]|nr:hypothetical protein SCG7109_BC_00050 [Chlamydiales bacterium SCGC AG-110-M15]
MTKHEIIQKKIEWDEQASSTTHPGSQVYRPSKSAWKSLSSDIIHKLKLSDKSHNLLDIGCGNGYLLESFLPFCFTVSGVDFSEQMINEAQERIPRASFKCADAIHIPFPKHSFSRILAYSIFHYFPDSDYAFTCIKKAIDLSTPGGLILLGDLLDKREEEKIKSASDKEYEKCIPLIARYSQWLFIDLDEVLTFVSSLGHKAVILDQPSHFPLSHYRKDIRIHVN